MIGAPPEHLIRCSIFFNRLSPLTQLCVIFFSFTHGYRFPESLRFDLQQPFLSILDSVSSSISKLTKPSPTLMEIRQIKSKIQQPDNLQKFK
ncbi:hypothetical protein ACLOJK_007472 [Asimina triloba]